MKSVHILCMFSISSKLKYYVWNPSQVDLELLKEFNQRKGTVFRNIQNTCSWNNYVLARRLFLTFDWVSMSLINSFGPWIKQGI